MNNKLRYHIWTIGCQMNKGESEQLATSLEEAGCIPSETIEACDIVVINSCVVRQSAENRVVSKVKSLEPLRKLNPNAIITLAGCIVDSDTSKLKRRFPHVDLFMKPGEFSELLEIVRSKAPKHIETVSTHTTSPTAFVTIIQGCNNFCSYCIVPYRRGREKSRPLTEIHLQIENLASAGVKEVTLLGQNVDSYGHDLPDNPDLADLLYNLNSINGLDRIRFLTSHPKDMSQKLIDAVAGIDKVCEYISLPVQAGDDAILQAMGRGYTSDYYYELVKRIRAIIPNVAISTDVVVGFPGETEQQFQKTLELLSDLRFDSVHVAAYSPRAGTQAANELEDNIPSSEKKRRLRMVEDLQKKIATEKNSELQGKLVEILVEAKHKGKWQGRTKTGKLVFFNSDEDYLGQLVNVEIYKTSPWSFQGLFQ